MSLKIMLRKILVKKGLSASAVANGANIPRSNINKWLNGANPDLKQLEKVARFLSVTIDDLIVVKDEEPSVKVNMHKNVSLDGVYEVSFKKIK